MWDLLWKVAFWQVFIPVLLFFPVSIILPAVRNPMHLQVVLKKRRNRSSVEMFQRQCFIRDRWHWTEEYSLLYLALFGTCVRLWPLCHRVYPCASGWPSDRPTRSRFHVVYLGRRASAVLHYSFEAPVLMATYLHNTWSSASLLPYVITEFCITQRGNLTLRYECVSAVYVGV